MLADLQQAKNEIKAFEVATQGQNSAFEFQV
jgi:hypothetical protein